MKAVLFSILVAVTARAAETNRLALTPKFLNELAEEARTNHPGMRAAESRVRAARAGERSVRLWDDPVVGVGAMAGPASMLREQGNVLWSIEEKLPINGKPQAEQEVMRAEIGVAGAEREMRFQTLRRDIVQSAIRAALADELLRISEQDQEWVATMVAATQARYQAGRSTQVEVLRMETEHATRAEQVRVASQERQSARLMLNRLLNRPLTNAWPELALPSLAPEIRATETLLGLGTRGDPKLRTLREEKMRAEASSVAVRKARRPDFMLGLQGQQYSGDGEFKVGALMLKMSLPWLNKEKYEASYLREKEKAEAAAWDAIEYEAQARDEISRLAIRIENARQQATLYRDQIIPRTETTLSTAETSWQNGKSFFHDVLDARRLLLEGRTMYARAVADQYLALSELVLCCGLSDLEALELYQNSNPVK
jgi:outer membrane protein TolC